MSLVSCSASTAVTSSETNERRCLGRGGRDPWKTTNEGAAKRLGGRSRAWSCDWRVSVLRHLFSVPHAAMDAQRHVDHLGKYRWCEYRDVASDAGVIDHAPQSTLTSAGKSPPPPPYRRQRDRRLPSAAQPTMAAVDAPPEGFCRLSRPLFMALPSACRLRVDGRVSPVLFQTFSERFAAVRYANCDSHCTR